MSPGLSRLYNVVKLTQVRCRATIANRNRMRRVYKAEVTPISLYGMFGDLNKIVHIQLALVNHSVSPRAIAGIPPT